MTMGESCLLLKHIQAEPQLRRHGAEITLAVQDFEDSLHKRRLTGGKQEKWRKKRK